MKVIRVQRKFKAAARSEPLQAVNGEDRLNAFVRSYLDRRETFLDIVRQHGSPLYVIEEQTVMDRAMKFTASFRAELPDLRVFYPVKANSHPLIVAAAVKAGLGLDVSSGIELQSALDTRARHIVFSGPAKTSDELILAIRNRARVTVLLDSPSEHERLESLAGRENAVVRAGVRLATNARGLWRKFGIPLADLTGYMEKNKTARHVELRGVQFHTSWNFDPSAYVAFIRRLGATLQTLSSAMRKLIEFIDIGGGFWPPPGQWLLGTDPAGYSQHSQASECGLRRVFLHALPIGEFARQIGAAIRSGVFPHDRCQIWLEPGRWICNDAMHILLTVMDRKGNDIAVTDGGTNAVGWERFENEYFPVINLSRPECVERPLHVLGSLCTPHDVWGYAYYGADIQPGDVLLIPAQGAYTYSLRQHFIKPLPRIILMRAGGSTIEWDDDLDERK